MFATADLGLPANDFQLVLINPIQPEPGPWPHRLVSASSMVEPRVASARCRPV